MSVNFSFEQVVLKLECTPWLYFVLFQDCPSRQEIQGSLKQVQKLLSAHEASYLQSLRNLKKKLNLLQSNAGKQTTRATNSKQNHQKDGKISAILLLFSFFLITLYISNRYLLKTGCTRQWEKTRQVTQRGPRGSLSVRPRLWTCRIREQVLSGKPGLEWPADFLQRWETHRGSHSRRCLSSSPNWRCYQTHWSLFTTLSLSSL